MTARVVVCCGSGGVGKTTVSASLALKLAIGGERVAVLTIDPAKRLADSLGIGDLSNEVRRVPLERAVPGATGLLDAAMLDAKATFDGLVRQYASSGDAAERILQNRYYQFVSTRLGGSHEYMAIERLLQLMQGGEYDVVILDTPPTRHALDFLTAPERLAAVLDEGVLRWLAMPTGTSGWRALELGSEVVAKVLRKLVGHGTIGEIAEFFDLFRDLTAKIHGRTGDVRKLLRDPSTRFLLVTTPAPSARAEALYFLDVLQARGLPFGGFLINRVVDPPATTLDPAALPVTGPLPEARWAEILTGLVRAPHLRAELAAAHARSIAALRQAGPAGAPCWCLPEQNQDLHDLAGLLGLGPFLPDRM